MKRICLFPEIGVQARPADQTSREAGPNQSEDRSRRVQKMDRREDGQGSAGNTS